MDGFSGQLPFLLLMLVIFFFFIILPQQRRTRKEKNYMNNLKKGDRVISNGNHAEIVRIPKNLIAKIPENVDDLFIRNALL